VYIQRTDLDGNLIWVKQYELPGAADYSLELIASGNGFVALTFDNLTKDGYLFKIDTIGEVVWAKSFLIDAVDFPTQNERANSQLIEAGNQLVFTGRDINATGDADLVLLRTDLNGDLQSPCIASQPMTIQAQEVSNPVFYAITPEEFFVDIDVTDHSPQVRDVFLSQKPVCVPDAVQSYLEVTICSGQEYESYSSSGMYQDTFLTMDGCDSIRTLDLTVEFFSVNETVQICQGASFEGYDQPGEYIDTLQGAAGACDTIRHLTLEVFPPLLTFINADICAGQNFLGYSTTGIHTDTLTAIDGCDSVRIVDLTVSDTIFSTIQTEVCFGELYEGYSESGTYQDTFASIFGCDSTRILELTVLDEIVSNSLIEICLGDTYEGQSVPGIYIDTMQAISGCDSIVRLQLDVVPVEQELFIELCPGQSFEQYTLPGTYIDTLQGITSPCDTIRNLTLSISLPIETSIVENICEGESYFGYTAPGMYTDTLVSVAGCDSIRTVALSLTESVESHLEADVCEGLFFGHSKPGTYIDTLISKAGCDSIRTVVLEGTTTYIPNIFSPNDDGINDLFEIISFPDKGLDLQYFGIFDRFGNMAYQTETWPVEWTGNDAKGRSFQPGVFAYILIYHCGQNKIIQHGNITLIK
jgi:gliding motility-associated-like protein